MYHRHQQGMTFWGLLFVLGVIGFCVFIAFKLFPPYMEDFKIKSAFNNLVKQSDIGTMTRNEMIAALYRRFNIDNVDGIKLEKDLIVETKGRIKLIRLHYENVIPLVSNISLLLEFDHMKEVASSE